jgi:hypothetical protein
MTLFCFYLSAKGIFSFEKKRKKGFVGQQTIEPTFRKQDIDRNRAFMNGVDEIMC